MFCLAVQKERGTMRTIDGGSIFDVMVASGSKNLTCEQKF